MYKTRFAAVALAALATASSALIPATASAADGNWLVRGRLIYLSPDNSDDTDLGLGLGINHKVMPEVDISYFFTPNIAAELVLTYPQKQNVHSDTLNKNIGTLKHLPPTLSVQYHFTDLGPFKPYVGLGLNYTVFSSVDILDGAATIKHHSFGAAFGGGFDYELSKGLYLNVDLKKVYIDTTVYTTANGVDHGKLKVDPILFGVGVGWRF